MNLQGKGTELGKDIPALIKSADNHDSFKEKYGEDAFGLCFDSFIMPILVADDGKKEAHEMQSKIALFCAAFID